MNLGGVIRLNKTGVIVTGCILVIFLLYMGRGGYKSDSPEVISIDLKHLLKVAIQAAEHGGLEVVSAVNNLNIRSKGLTKEGMQDDVTNADLRSQCAILSTITSEYPDLHIVSEEGNIMCDDSKKYVDFQDSFLDHLELHFESSSDVTVWIDPLDATHEYTEKMYEFVTTMVCIAVKGYPIIGVIHKPFAKSNQTTWAWDKVAHSHNLQPPHNVSNNDKKKIIISRSHRGEIETTLSRNWGKSNYDLVVAAGSGYKSLEVANGHVDSYLHVTAIKKWDICAGNAIVNAVGGKMTTKFNEEIDYGSSGGVRNVNERGLVVSLKNHDLFVEKLK